MKTAWSRLCGQQRVILLLLPAILAVFAALIAVARGETVARGSWTIYAVAAVIALLSMAMVAFPELLLRWNHRLFVEKPTPTAFYWVAVHASWYAVTALVLGGCWVALRTIP